MNVLFDTSTLIAATTRAHKHHQFARPWLEAAHQGRINLIVSCHSMAEFYRVMTTVKSSPPLTTQQVWRLLQDEILAFATVVELTQVDYAACLSRLAQVNARGGIVFDSLIVQAALKAGVDHLISLNSTDFERVWPNHTNEVINPLTTPAP
jgi:predicted nucleic acid-binding protein